MGAGQIIQKNITQSTTSLWDMLPVLPTFKLFDFNTNSYNKHFINIGVIVGVISLAKITLFFGQKLNKSFHSDSLLSAQQLGKKYGFNSWVIIADCRQNEQYCKFFAKNNFNLILIGSQQDVRIAKDQVQLINSEVKIQVIVVNWQNEESNIAFYQQLVHNLQNFDISFLILPKILQSKQKIPTHLQRVQPFSNIYLLVRYFGQKLKWRSYKSAIVFPSYQNHEQVTNQNGISKALIAGSDAFGRIINFELRDSIQVIVDRAGVQKTMKSLGNKGISR